jgi:hypothetical protein
MRKSVAAEGWGVLWAGFSAMYMRLGPHTAISFIVLEQLRQFFATAMR